MEGRKIRRVLANRESAGQTIRRRQAMFEELTKKAVDIAWRNENLKRGTGSGLGEHPFKGPESDTRVTETINSTPPTDLAEQYFQAFKNISQEHPTACVRALDCLYPNACVRQEGLMAVLSYLGFFSTRIQCVMLSTAANVCKKPPSDAVDLVMEVVTLIDKSSLIP